MEEVKAHITYKVSSYINRSWFPVLIPIGLVGNTLSFLVVIQPSNRKISTCIYMAAISVNDELMMCFALHDWLIGVGNIHEWNLWGCKIASLLTNFSLRTATYQVLVMTIDKYIAIKWPHKATTYSTSARVRLVLYGIFVFALIYNIPHLFVASLLREECLSYLVGGTITKSIFLGNLSCKRDHSFLNFDLHELCSNCEEKPGKCSVYVKEMLGRKILQIFTLKWKQGKEQ